MNASVRPRDIIKTAEIPSIPHVLQEILSLVDNPQVSSAELEKIVLEEPGLVTNLLRLVNSAYYSLPQRISSIRHSMILLGFSTVKSIAMGLSLIDAFNSMVNVNKEYFLHVWQRALASSQFMKVICSHETVVMRDDLFLTAMVHHVGHLIMSQYFKGKYHELTQNTLFPNPEEEREKLGTDHAEIGGELLVEWKFSEFVMQIVRYHHDRAKYEGDKRHIVAIDLSDLLADKLRENPDFMEIDEKDQDPTMMQMMRIVAAGKADIWGKLMMQKGALKKSIEDIQQLLLSGK